MSLAAGRSTPDISRVGEAIGEELSAIGVRWYLVPAVNNATILTEPLDASESFSDDFEAVSHYAAAFIGGISAGGVLCCPTIDLTSTIQEEYSMSDDQDMDIQEIARRDDTQVLLHSVSLPGLNSLLLKASLEGFEDVERATTRYRRIVKELIRKNLGYEGVIVLDCSEVSEEMGACKKHSALRALLSGSDMVILPSNHGDQIANIQAIHAAAASPSMPSMGTAEALKRIASFKSELTMPQAQTSQTERRIILQQHASLSRDAYRRATTSLSPTPSPLTDLQLSPKNILLLLTPSVPQSSMLAGPSPINPFESLGRALAKVHRATRHVPYNLSSGWTTRQSAFFEVRVAAVVLVLCNPSSAFQEHQQEFIEGLQHELQMQQSIPGGQEIAKVVLAAGDARDLNQPLEGWWEVCCYEYTPEALEAAAEVILGQRIATGRLPVKLSRRHRVD